jgi:hypothetical protein
LAVLFRDGIVRVIGRAPRGKNNTTANALVEIYILPP